MTPQGHFPKGLLILLIREVKLIYPAPMILVTYLLLPVVLIYIAFDLVESSVKLNAELAAAEGRTSPSPAQQAVPGFTLLVAGFLAATTALRVTLERERGLWKKFMVAPIWKPSVVLSTVINVFILGVVEILIIFGFGSLAFDMSWGGAYLGIILLTAAFVLVPVGIGLLIASLSQDTNLQGPLIYFIFVVLGLVGGALVPRFLIDDWVQNLSYLTPHYWALEGFQDLIVRDASLTDILPSLIILTLMGGVPLILGLARFRRREYL